MNKRAPSYKKRIDNIKELLKVLKDAEVTYFSDQELKIEFGPKKLKPLDNKPPSKEDVIKQQEDLLFYSSR